MIPVALMVSVGLLVLAMIILYLARSGSLDYERTRTQLRQPAAETLAYDVPEGQDPADVIVALTHAGYPAVEDLAGGTYQVLVHCPHGRQGDRSRVREVIERVCASGAIGHDQHAHAVRFADES